VSDRPAPVDLKDLIRAVRDKTRSCTELERLDVAVQYGELVKNIGDDLVGHFVEEARAAGASWAQVGERLGVTKQAAHQRHVYRAPRLFDRRSRSSGQGPFKRFTKEARGLVVTAQDEARSLRHNYIGIEHLLIALSEDAAAGPLLRAAGASRGAILEQVRSIVGEGTGTPSGPIPFTPRAKRALELAARAADRSGRQVGPADVLIGVLDIRQGVGAAVLDALGVSRDELRQGARAVRPSDD
jgi:ClpA/ClpB-like protein